MTENAEIKMKLASKLVSMLSLNENNEEEFFQAIKNIFVALLGSDDDLDFIFKTFKEEYSYNEILEEIAIIYTKHFTEDDMLDMINFYNTPTGQKWVRKHPLIVSEIMDVNHKYGLTLTEKILKKMDK